VGGLIGSVAGQAAGQACCISADKTVTWIPCVCLRAGGAAPGGPGMPRRPHHRCTADERPRPLLPGRPRYRAAAGRRAVAVARVAQHVCLPRHRGRRRAARAAARAQGARAARHEGRLGMGGGDWLGWAPRAWGSACRCLAAAGCVLLAVPGRSASGRSIELQPCTPRAGPHPAPCPLRRRHTTTTRCGACARRGARRRPRPSRRRCTRRASPRPTLLSCAWAPRAPAAPSAGRARRRRARMCGLLLLEWPLSRVTSHTRSGSLIGPPALRLLPHRLPRRMPPRAFPPGTCWTCTWRPLP
jgi:hypothetical protein